MGLRAVLSSKQGSVDDDVELLGKHPTDINTMKEKRESSSWPFFLVLFILCILFIATILRSCSLRKRPVPLVIHIVWSEDVEMRCVKAAAARAPVVIHTTDPLKTLKKLSAVGPWPPSLKILRSKPHGPLTPLQILRDHGGIVIGSNMCLVADIDALRQHEVTVSFSRGRVQGELVAGVASSPLVEEWLSQAKEAVVLTKPSRGLHPKLPPAPVTWPEFVSKLGHPHILNDAVLPIFRQVFFVPAELDFNKVIALRFIKD